MAAKEVTESNAPAGAALIAQAMDRREGAGRYKAMQSIMDWDRSRLVYRAGKRSFDIVFSGAVLVVIAIPSLVLAALIRLESDGSPFYSQIRVGQTRPDGSLTTFRMWKFRSMYKDADERLAELKGQNEIAGAMFKMREDPRVTKIGRFIRKHSIDEFPQFLNVFLGQMSVVGPRPPLPNEVAEYTSTTVRRTIFKSVMGPRLAMYSKSRRTMPSKSVSLRSVTCHQPVMPGFTAKRCRSYSVYSATSLGSGGRGPTTDLKIVLLTVVEVFTGGGAC